MSSIVLKIHTSWVKNIRLTASSLTNFMHFANSGNFLGIILVNNDHFHLSRRINVADKAKTRKIRISSWPMKKRRNSKRSTMSENIHKVTKMIFSSLLQMMTIFVTRSSAVFLTSKQVIRILSTEKSVIVDYFNSCHPIWRKIMRNLKQQYQNVSMNSLLFMKLRSRPKL